MPKKSPSASHSLLAAAVTCMVPCSLSLRSRCLPPRLPARRCAHTGGWPRLTGPANPKLPSLILVGDSTVRNGHGTGSDGLWGWGAPIANLFDPTKINVVNRAIGGLSSHTYISQGHWASTLELIKPGDFVLIQFGHNDGGVNLPGAVPIPIRVFFPAPPARAHAGAAPRASNGRGSLPGFGDETLDVANPEPIPRKPSIPLAGTCASTSPIPGPKARPHSLLACPAQAVARRPRHSQHQHVPWLTQQVAAQQHVGFVDLNEIIARRYDALGRPPSIRSLAIPHAHHTRRGATQRRVRRCGPARAARRPSRTISFRARQSHQALPGELIHSQAACFQCGFSRRGICNASCRFSFNQHRKHKPRSA